MNKSIKKEDDHIFLVTLFFGYFNVFSHFHWKSSI